MLRCVREDRRLLEPVAVQGRADSADLAVHHRAWSYEVGPRACLAHGRLGEQFEGGVVVDSTIPDYAAMPVVGIFAEADIRHRDEIRCGPLHRTNGFLHDAVFVVRSLAERILLRREAEEDHGGDAKFRQLLRLGRGLVHRQSKDARHGGNRRLHAGILPNEEWLHETIGVDGRLSDERTDGGGPPQPSGPIAGTRELSHGHEPPLSFRRARRPCGSARPRTLGTRENVRPPR